MTQTGCSNSRHGARGLATRATRQNLQNYNVAFKTFFQRLADDGIDKSNTLFVITADEGDHFAGANANRAVQPTCGAAPVGWQNNSTCDYSGGNKIGEMQVSIHGLLQNQLNNTTPFYDEPQGNSIYITGNPGPNDPSTRQLERDFSNATVNDVYDGNVQENLTQYEADPTVEQLLHFVNADANRTPSFTMFPKPDYFLTGGISDGSPANSCQSGVNQGECLAEVHDASTTASPGTTGTTHPRSTTRTSGSSGPGVAHKGVDGSAADQGPNSDGTANSNPQLVTSIANPGTWADHTDTRPTLMALDRAQGRLHRRWTRPDRGSDDQTRPDRRQDVPAAGGLLQAAQLERRPVRHGRARRRHGRSEDGVRRQRQGVPGHVGSDQEPRR